MRQWLRRKCFALLVCPVVLGLTTGTAFGLRQTPGVIESGDNISFSIPMQSGAANLDNLHNVRLILVSAPPWLTSQPTSILGPLTLPPGEPKTFRMDFQVNNALTSSNRQTEVVVEIKTDDNDTHASRFVWHFRTSNAFLTYSAECLDEAGRSFGGALSADKTAPDTSIFYYGPTFADTSGNLFISSSTSVGLDAGDFIFPDALTSGVAFTGYALDQAIGNISQLTSFVSTFTLSPGNHFIMFASSDNAGNVEPLRTQTLRNC